MRGDLADQIQMATTVTALRTLDKPVEVTSPAG